ncbi:LysR family transcriptional regulator [Vibrio lentus]|uniref:LysR family transcriptional regulator n=1 Tax=Vibrio lentus TaxID=136468 RepID=UPI000C8371C0|nr:LysR family transcriptional regulator [Vibrio lentus]MCC4818262.1 LysR family transcriptional regulator [Vibrio lentus]PMG71285.1 LysR family transcriptional regulator [Vibrio lentus]PMK86258.1 LysR family transcriptional regulator [Vibrio lentus]PML21365.1 LysR family transcriptional regulator [Vibrio lentus]PMM24078.1 LysR family transcriptional regulator [Vibrio lentus]
MADISKLEIKQLRVLSAVLKHQSLTKASTQLGITQQAVSEQLRKLREIFQDRLFIRSSHGVVATPKAQALEPKIQQILLAIGALSDSSHFNPANLNGVYRISASDYAIQVILPSLLAGIRKCAPNLKIIIRRFESDNLYQLMASGDVDLALTFPSFIPETCPSMLLYEERHLGVTAKGHAELFTGLSLAEVAAAPQLVISPSRANLKGSADEWFASKGYKRNTIMSLPSFSAAPDCIAAMEVLAFLPSRMLPNDKLAEIALPEPLPTFEVIAAWHPRSSQDQTHAWIKSLLQDLYM